MPDPLAQSCPGALTCLSALWLLVDSRTVRQQAFTGTTSCAGSPALSVNYGNCQCIQRSTVVPGGPAWYRLTPVNLTSNPCCPNGPPNVNAACTPPTTAPAAASSLVPAAAVALLAVVVAVL